MSWRRWWFMLTIGLAMHMWIGVSNGLWEGWFCWKDEWESAKHEEPED